MCNPLYTAYFTTVSKDRQTVLEVLRNGQPATFLFNDEAEALLEGLGTSKALRQQLAALPREQVMDEATIRGLLAEQVPNLGPQQQRCPP